MAKQTKRARDPVMARIKAIIAENGLTQQELGERMKYPAESARKSVSQFLRTDDPRLSTIRRFAAAVKMKLTDLLK